MDYLTDKLTVVLPSYCLGGQDYVFCKDEICRTINKDGTWLQMTKAYDDSLWYFILELCSSLMGALFGAFILYTKELQVHPMKLIMYLAFVESVFQILIVQNDYICAQKYNYVFSWTIFFGASDYDVARATVILTQSSAFIATMCIGMSICLNTCICIDLILMVRYPFTKKEPRVRLYLLGSLLVSIPTSFFNVNFEDNDKSLYRGAFCTVTMFSIFIIAFLVSTIYTCGKLRGPGMSKQVRGLVLNRHVATMIVYAVCNIYIYIVPFCMVIPDWRQYLMTSNQWYIKMFKILFAAQGFLIPMMRLSEPYFFKILSKTLKKLCNRGAERV